MCMCMLTKRAHILFEPSTWDLLNHISNTQDISIGQAVRKAVNKTYLKTNQSLTRKQLVKRIKANHKLLNNPEKPIDYKALINHGRKY